MKKQKGQQPHCQFCNKNSEERIANVLRGHWPKERLCESVYCRQSAREGENGASNGIEDGKSSSARIMRGSRVF